jgi:hypothetical protein
MFGGKAGLRKTKLDKLVVGGLHTDDFEWASRQYEDIGYVLVAFVMDCDGYHWKAVYVKADQLEKRVGGRGLPVSVSLCPPME